MNNKETLVKQNIIQFSFLQTFFFSLFFILNYIAK